MFANFSNHQYTESTLFFSQKDMGVNMDSTHWGQSREHFCAVESKEPSLVSLMLRTEAQRPEGKMIWKARWPNDPV